MPTTPNHDCPYCSSPLAIAAMTCDHCHVRIDAPFPMSHLARLPIEHQRFIELFILCGGNLKDLAAQFDVSYPTIRSRFDKVIDSLRRQIDAPPDAPAPSAAAPAKQITI